MYVALLAYLILRAFLHLSKALLSAEAIAVYLLALYFEYLEEGVVVDLSSNLQAFNHSKVPFEASHSLAKRVNICTLFSSFYLLVFCTLLHLFR